MDRCSAISRNTLPTINRLLGLDYNGQVTFVIEAGMKAPAATSGDKVTLNPRWFNDHPNDDGVVHELVYVVMNCPRMDSSNWWMIEGIADYVRDKLGYRTPWSSPKKGDPKSGYQSTADFLLFLEGRFGQDYIKQIATGLSPTGDLPDDIESRSSVYLAA